MRYSAVPLQEKEYQQIATNYYVLRSEWRLMTSDEKHLALCVYVANRRKNFILTAQSAFIAYGIPRLDSVELRPHAVRINNKKADIVRWHYRSTRPAFKTINGLFVVSPLYAIVDAAIASTPESLLVSINHCLHNKMFIKNEFITELQLLSRTKGNKRLKRLIEFATAECESPLETIAWIAIYKASLVMPKQQVKVSTGQNQSAIVDMYWELGGRRIILELDGRIKYSDGQVLFDEKKREDKLRAMGYEIIRCVWADVISGKLIQTLIKIGIPQRRNFGKKFPS